MASVLVHSMPNSEIGKETLTQRNFSLKRVYTTIFSQKFSPCGRYLAVSDNYGDVSVFHISDTSQGDGPHLPVYRFQAHDSPVYALTSTDKLLLTAGTGFIKAFDWSDIVAKSAKVAWTLSIPSGNNYDTPEANALVISKDEKLIAGCGDNKVHIWDLEAGQHLTSLQGHTSYIHDVVLWKNRCISSGEDGNVLLWDDRAGAEPVLTLQPYKTDRCARPELGKWVGCVAVDDSDDWLVCGGGPTMSLWHLQSLSCTTIFETPGHCQNFVKFHDDGIVSGGTAGRVEYWAIDGTVRAQVPCKPNNIFNICANKSEANSNILSVAGSGAKIDIFTSRAYTTCSLNVR